MAIPYESSDKGKKEQVAEMFDNIAHRYDFLNHFLSVGIDKYWRWKAVKILKKNSPNQILDVATGTADFAIALSKLKPQKITGIDISSGMLDIGKKKVLHNHLEHMIHLELGDSEKLPFADNSFDAVTVAFGVRNFENLTQGLSEIFRVMSPGGKVVILEFSKPTHFPIKQIYNFYFRKILPFIGSFFSKDKSAYTYLPESVNEFPHGNEFEKILNNCHFINTKTINLTFGVSSLYVAEK